MKKQAFLLGMLCMSSYAYSITYDDAQAAGNSLVRLFQTVMPPNEKIAKLMPRVILYIIANLGA